MREREIQRWLIKNIEEDKFYSLIENKDNLDNIVSSIYDISRMPSFSVDYLARKKNALAAKNVLENFSLIEIVSVDNSISRTKGEILRPDVVAYNPEKKSILIFEIKKESQTAREAITELLAYEHEVQNHLPFTSSYEICFILISREWSTLLNHSITSLNSWGSKNILGLQLNTLPSKWKLSIHLPDVWKKLSSTGLPKDSISTATICLYKNHRNQKKVKSNKIPLHCFTALDIIEGKGNLNNTHGFAVLWKDLNPLSECDYNITVCSLNPIKFFESSLLYSADDKSKLTKYLNRKIDEITLSPPNSMFKIAESAISLLKIKWKPMYEGFFTWETAQRVFESNSIPIKFSFWGELKDYVMDYITHPSVIAYHNKMISDYAFNWSDPEIAVPLLDDLLGDKILQDGMLTAVECFRIGELLGIMQFCLFNITKTNPKISKNLRNMLTSIYTWKKYRLISLVNELNYLVNAKKDKVSPPPKLKINISKDSLDLLDKFINWILKEIITENYSTHRAALLMGLKSACLFDNSLSTIIRKEDKFEIIDNVKDEINFLYRIVKEGCIESIKNKNFNKKNLYNFNKIKRLNINLFNEKKNVNVLMALIRTVREEILELHDKVLPVIFHDITPVKLGSIDWDDIKNQIIEMHNSGNKNAVVILLPNGILGVGTCEKPPFLDISKINPKEKVLFWNQLHGVDLIIIETWKNLESGKTFEMFNKIYN